MCNHLFVFAVFSLNLCYYMYGDETRFCHPLKFAKSHVGNEIMSHGGIEIMEGLKSCLILSIVFHISYLRLLFFRACGQNR